MRFARPALALATLLAAPGLASAQDQDGDGVADDVDTYPCDPALAAEAFAPAEGAWGTLLFEDEWPAAGDQDLNDLVLDYHYQVRADALGRAVRIDATFHVGALGGRTPLGLGLHLPVARGAAGLARVTDRLGARDVDAMPDAEATWILADELGALFVGQATPFNVVAGQPAVAGQTITVRVDLPTPTALDMSEAPFDVFVFQTFAPERETHRSSYAGTSRMDPALFGTADDGSANGRYFVDAAGLPFVLDVPQSSDYPLEETHVAQLWPTITEFAATAGASAADFYTTAQGGFRYTARPASPGLTASVPDTSCVPNGSYPDPAGFNRLWHVAQYGDDATGDGSDVNPFASLHVAIAAAASGDGIQIHPGLYRLVPQVHYSGYMVAGIYDQRKRLHIFGANGQTILEVRSADNTSHRDAHVFSLKGQQNINGTVYGSVLSNFVVHFFPNRSTNYSNAIAGWSSSGAEVHNVVFENHSASHNWAYVYDNNNPYDTPRFFNSVFVSNGRWTTRYTGRPSYINCIMENVPAAYSLLRNNVYRRASGADLGGGAIPADLANAGDPATTNPDGARAHIGVRGGRFAWP